MKTPLLLLALMPLVASAQPGMPAGYGCTHYNDYYPQGTPPPGQPNECEAMGSSHAKGEDNNFTYFFPLGFGADGPVAAPEIGRHDAFAGLAFIVGLMAIAKGRRKRT